MIHHTTRAILALIVTAAALAIAAPAHAAGHVVGAAVPVQPQDDLTSAEKMLVQSGVDTVGRVQQLVETQGHEEDRGIVGMALDLLTGTAPEA